MQNIHSLVHTWKKLLVFKTVWILLNIGFSFLRIIPYERLPLLCSGGVSFRYLWQHVLMCIFTTFNLGLSYIESLWSYGLLELITHKSIESIELAEWYKLFGIPIYLIFGLSAIFWDSGVHNFVLGSRIQYYQARFPDKATIKIIICFHWKLGQIVIIKHTIFLKIHDLWIDLTVQKQY